MPPEAAEWMVAALDPFHDNQLRLEGLPDMMSGPTIVKMHTQSVNLTQPASAVATGEWDAVVSFTGCLSEIGSNPMLATTSDHEPWECDYLSTAGYANPLCSKFGTFIVKACVAGANMPFGAPAGVGNTHEAYGGCAIWPQGDRCRLIGVAYEVVNTTADMYKQGSVTTAALPVPQADYGIVKYIDGDAVNETMFWQSWFGPKFAAQAGDLAQIPGSNTWEAREGVYAIPRLHTATLGTESPTTNERAVVIQDSRTGVSKFHNSQPMAEVHHTPIVYGVGATGFGPIQSYFAGLSAETTLRVTMRTIVEYFPTMGSSLLEVCTPSPSYSPRTFKMYSQIAQVAPYAVPVGQNAAGDYFKKILRVAAAAGRAIAPFTGPAAPFISLGASGASALAGILERNPKKKAQPQKIVTSADLTKFNKALALSRPTGPAIRRKEAGARASPTRR